MARKLQNLTHWTDAQLQAGWVNGFEVRVKSGRRKGHIKYKAIRLGDAILREASKRGVRLETPIKYQ